MARYIPWPDIYRAPIYRALIYTVSPSLQCMKPSPEIPFNFMKKLKVIATPINRTLAQLYALSYNDILCILFFLRQARYFGILIKYFYETQLREYSEAGAEITETFKIQKTYLQLPFELSIQ